MKRIIISMLLTIALGFGAAMAQSSHSMSKKSDSPMTKSNSKWIEVCQTQVNLKAGRDEFPVNNSETFRAIRVEAKDQPVTLTDLELFYKNGATQSISLNELIQPKSESRKIDLSGKSCIAKIDLQYKVPEGMTGMKHENATIEILGLTASNMTQKKY